MTTIPFAEAWSVDFEYRAPPGELPHIECMVGSEYLSGREVRLSRDELLSLKRPPFDLERAAFFAYYASAEMGCFLELGWPPPPHVVDLYIEHRVQTNGLPRPKRSRPKGKAQSGQVRKGIGRDGLLGALALRGLAHIDADAKTTMRELILAEANPSPAQRAAILDYCASDVVGNEALARYMVERESN
jgi:hypothetical protein